MSDPLDLSDLRLALADLIIDSTNSILETSSDTMAPPILDRHAFDFIPDFDGKNSDILNNFIQGIDLIVARFAIVTQPVNADGQYQNFQILNGILSKIKGEAKQVVNANLCQDWKSIKDILTRTFSDPRDENEILYELISLRPKPSYPFIQYYNTHINMLAYMLRNYLQTKQIGTKLKMK